MIESAASCGNFWISKVRRATMPPVVEGREQPMKVIDTALAEVKIYMPKRHVDGRGYFSEWYNARDLAATGLARQFRQDNIAFSKEAGTVRGLNFQIPPHAQAKLVGVLRGAAFDVVVDVRGGSPTFGRHVTVELSAEFGNQIFVPEGFAHGICNLVPDTLVSYKVTDYFDAACDAGIAWDDPDLAIAWPVEAGRARLSDRDRRLPKLSALDPPPFRYEGPN
jgi:dTDP-4-dehydrorhamnose 3,5-epimerase